MEPMEVSRTSPAKASPPAGSESCVARRVDPGLRSVDSERESLVLSLENACLVGAQAVKVVEGNTDALETPLAAKGLGASDPPGSETRACAQGFPRNLGGPVASAWMAPPQRRGAVPPSEGNEARREG